MFALPMRTTRALSVPQIRSRGNFPRGGTASSGPVEAGGAEREMQPAKTGRAFAMILNTGYDVLSFPSAWSLLAVAAQCIRNASAASFACGIETRSGAVPAARELIPLLSALQVNMESGLIDPERVHEMANQILDPVGRQVALGEDCLTHG